jgi:hypothetical protein
MERKIRIFFKLFAAFLIISETISAQSNFLYNKDVTEFLEEFDSRGIISINHHSKPFTRKMIFDALNEIHKKDASLTKSQKEWLDHYIAEFNYNNPETDTSLTIFLEKNSHGAFRVFEYTDGSKSIVLYPDAGLSYSSRGSGKYSYTYYNGLSGYGHAGKHFSFDLDFNDVSISREGYPFQSLLSIERGFDYPRYNRSNETLNYDRTTASVTAGWDWGYVSLKKDYNYWGTGFNGNLILSDKAPSFPHLYFYAKPFNWLEFNYFYGELNSSINDSSTIRNSGGTRGHIQLVDKYIASHMVTADIFNNLKLSLGESVIISDRFEPIYLVPILFFRMADHYLSHTDYNSGNAQVFASVSYRIPVASTRLDFSLFIDELKVTDLNAPKAIGYSVGLTSFGFPANNLIIQSEYVKIDPFVYLHADPVQTYTNRKFSMGHWIGSNSDMININLIYKPVVKFRIKTSLSYIRKGDIEDISQPRYETGQGFLFGDRSYFLISNTDISYEIFNNIFLTTGLTISNSWGKSNRINLTDHKFTEFGLGVKAGFL